MHTGFRVISPGFSGGCLVSEVLGKLSFEIASFSISFSLASISFGTSYGSVLLFARFAR
jgi:hypothetical protein